MEDEAAVITDAGDGPGLPVRDLEGGVVAAGTDPVPEPDSLPASGRDHVIAPVIVDRMVIADRGGALGCPCTGGYRPMRDK